MKRVQALDPAGEKRHAKQRDVQKATTFGTIFEEWYKLKHEVWSEGYAVELLSMFEKDILPHIGHLTMEEVEPIVLPCVLRQFEERGAIERANKARGKRGEVFRYAVVTGRAKYNPAPDLADALRGYRKKNYPFLPQARFRRSIKRWQPIPGAS